MTNATNSLARTGELSASRSISQLADVANAHNKEAIFDVLSEARIHLLTVSFDGYGDSGQIESIDASDAGDTTIEVPVQRQVRLLTPHEVTLCLEPEVKSLTDAIEGLVYEYLEAHHMGWENGEGAYGTFVFEVPERVVRLEHNQRFVDTDTTLHTF